MKGVQHTLSGWVCAVQAADSGSFTAAARVLDLTPAAVSKNVAALEARLGVRLFNRTTRQLSLTDEGRRFVAQARSGLQQLEAAGAAARQDDEPEGVVRLSCGHGFGRRFVLPLLPALLQRHPRLRVELSLSDARVDLVRDGFDVGIRGAAAPPEGMVARPLCRIPLVLVATPQYLSRVPEPTDWRGLAAHQLVGVRFASGQVSAWSFRERGQVLAWQPQAALMLSDPEAVLDAVLAHMGIAQIGLHHAWPALQSGALKQVLARQHEGGLIEMALFYPHRIGLAPRVRALVEHLVQGLGTLPELQLRLSSNGRIQPPAKPNRNPSKNNPASAFNAS